MTARSAVIACCLIVVGASMTAGQVQLEQRIGGIAAAVALLVYMYRLERQDSGGKEDK